MDEKINLNQETLKIFYEQFGSKNFNLQQEISKDFGEKILNLYYKSIDFIYKTITTIGIIAGFGFTAMSHIKSYTLFITGEGFLLSAIAVGIWAIQSIYLKERNNLDKFYGKIKKNFWEWYEVFKPAFDKASKGELVKDDIVALRKKEWELVSIFTNNRSDFEEGRKDNLPIIIRVIFCLFIIGGTALLLSFITC